MKGWFATIRAWRLPARLLVLVAAVLIVYAVTAPIAGALSGVAGLAAAATAAALCWLGAAAAMILAEAFRDPGRVLQGVLYGMLLRMGIPLFSALALQLWVAWLADAYVLIYFLVFYPVTLVVERALSLSSARTHRGRDGESSGAVVREVR